MKLLLGFLAYSIIAATVQVELHHLIDLPRMEWWQSAAVALAYQAQGMATGLFIWSQMGLLR